MRAGGRLRAARLRLALTPAGVQVHRTRTTALVASGLSRDRTDLPTSQGGHRTAHVVARSTTSGPSIGAAATVPRVSESTSSACRGEVHRCSLDLSDPLDEGSLGLTAGTTLPLGGRPAKACRVAGA